MAFRTRNKKPSRPYNTVLDFEYLIKGISKKQYINIKWPVQDNQEKIKLNDFVIKSINFVNKYTGPVDIVDQGNDDNFILSDFNINTIKFTDYPIIKLADQDEDEELNINDFKLIGFLYKKYDDGELLGEYEG